jgi:hypothetical protein
MKYSLGLHPKTPNFLTHCCLLFFGLVDCYAVVLKQTSPFILGVAPQTCVTFFLDKKVTKKSRLMIFLLQVTLVVYRAIKAISLRFIS